MARSYAASTAGTKTCSVARFGPFVSFMPPPIISFESPMWISQCVPPAPPFVRSVSFAPKTFLAKSIKSSTSSTTRYGVTSRTSIVVAVIRPPNLRLNSGSGRSRRSAAIATNASSSRGIDTSAAPSRMAWMAWSSASCRSAMRPPHLRAQRLDGAELQLLDGPLAAAELARHVGDGALLGEALDEHGALRRRQRVDEAEEEGAAFDVVVDGEVAIVQRRFAAGVARAVVQHVRRDPVQPRHERHPVALLVAADAFEGLVENVGDHVFRLRAIAHPPRHERVHALEVLLVELGESRSLVHCRSA